ncbi:hypothetical protein CBS147333_6612 [Penicillium roqueforti]|nr:hypothetical protein CBS147333_6612 [Penicillium roqueforti]
MLGSPRQPLPPFFPRLAESTSFSPSSLFIFRFISSFSSSFLFLVSRFWSIYSKPPPPFFFGNNSRGS